ncbi:zf-TFIIB domain-containing protein [Spirulina subsalsa]|uniref:TFIIB-type zinc ribbon-containing protein n=1 Tax=Spirulina subsalsa TaxID=54311 RepID=UPI000381A2FD|nr:zf-TFIIB domain-containing protein [Spirulina subsalsa]
MEENESVECPKCRKPILQEKQLGDISALCCDQCQGRWLPGDSYKQWQVQHPPKTATPDVLLQGVDSNFQPSTLDSRAGLCPECSRYLSRAAVKTQPPFFVERCPHCEGIWCDAGEWELLTRLGLSSSIEQFFDRQWQMQVREQESLQTERQTLMDKLGPELAQIIFDLADHLMSHPNGDYALAYLMRKIMNNTDWAEFKDKQTLSQAIAEEIR